MIPHDLVRSVNRGSTAFLWNEDFLKYSLGPSHPFQPHREKRTLDLLSEMGAFGDDAVVVEPRSATEEEVAMVHTAEHIRFVKETCARGHGMLDNGDTPVTKELFAGSLAAVGASIVGADLVMKGEAEHAFNPAGGLHHARSYASAGFCVFNDLAVAARHLQRTYGLQRVAIVDVDGHHGDGTQEIFYRERVLTISLHRYGRGFYPGSGSVEEVGEGEGAGFHLNVPLPYRTGHETYIKAYEEVVLPALRAYRPEFIIHQFGADGHFADPLVGLGMTTRTYEEVAKLTHEAAHELCGGRYLVAGGGGYKEEAVARSWAIMFCAISGLDVPLRSRIDGLHDVSGIEEPAGNAELVEAVIGQLKAEVLPRIGRH